MWPQSGWLEVGGVRLEVACHGPPPGSAPTLVMLHEGLGCVALWRGLPEALAAASGWGVFVFSRRGYGASDPSTLPLPLDYMTREAMEVLPALLSVAGIERYALLGHSDGATIAAIHAGRSAPEGLLGAGLIAPHFFTEPKGLAAIAEAGRAFEHGDLRARLARYHAHVDCAFGGWNGAWLDPGFRDWNVADVLETIRVPILALQGEEDAYGTLAQIDAITTRCPAVVTRVILPDCGHAPHLEKPDDTQAAILHWIDKLDA